MKVEETKMEVEPAIGEAKAMFAQLGWDYIVKSSDDVKISGHVKNQQAGYGDEAAFAADYDKIKAPEGWKLTSAAEAFPLVIFENENVPFLQDLFKNLFNKET